MKKKLGFSFYLILFFFFLLLGKNANHFPNKNVRQKHKFKEVFIDYSPQKEEENVLTVHYSSTLCLYLPDTLIMIITIVSKADYFSFLGCFF